MNHTGPVVVVGGGIAGLTAALELAESGAAVALVEAGERFGGKIATSRVDGLVVEAGADSFLSSKPAGLAPVGSCAVRIVAHPDVAARRRHDPPCAFAADPATEPDGPQRQGFWIRNEIEYLRR